MKEKKRKIEMLIDNEIDKIILNEQDYGAEYDSLGGIYDDYYGSMGYGYGHYGGGGKASGILNILPIGIVPRVGKTLLWGVANMSARVLRLLKTLFTFVAKAFVPQLKILNDYEEIRNDEIKTLEKIDKKYAKVLSENMQVLKNLDAWGIVFLLDPSLGLGWKLAETAPSLAINLLDALTAGKAQVLLKSYLEKNKYKTKGNYKNIFNLFSQAGFYSSSSDFDLYEQVQNQEQEKELIKNFFSSKEVNQAINSSGVAPKIRAFARNAILSRINKVLAAKTIEELMQTAPELSNQIKVTLDTLMQEAQNNKFNENEIAQAKAGLLGQIKEQEKKIAIENLTKAAQKNATINSMVSNIIKQIKTIK
jgi:hypothetical protein